MDVSLIPAADLLGRSPVPLPDSTPDGVQEMAAAVAAANPQGGTWAPSARAAASDSSPTWPITRNSVARPAVDSLSACVVPLRNHRRETHVRSIGRGGRTALTNAIRHLDRTGASHEAS